MGEWIISHKHLFLALFWALPLIALPFIVYFFLKAETRRKQLIKEGKWK